MGGILPWIVAILLHVSGLCFHSTFAFSPQPLESKRIHSSFICQNQIPPEVEELNLFDTEGWRIIQKDLDQVPVFTCANQDGDPLAYNIRIKENTFTVPFFYCDAEEAQRELDTILREEDQSVLVDTFNVIAFPLGKAFQMWSQDQAVILPSVKALQQAGAPPGCSPIGQQVPLFACMDIMQSDDSGAFLPLFFDCDEAKDAIASAVAVDGGNVQDFEVVTLSLPKAVELLSTVPDTPSFQFIPPQTSLQYIQENLT
jgi:hypothetical protein